MTNVAYSIVNGVGHGVLPDGTEFLFDADKLYRIAGTEWYRNTRADNPKELYIIDRRGNPLHRALVDCPEGYEVDHISMDTLDNRSVNLRIVTHQQNQCNQAVQKNSPTGVTGVNPASRYPDRYRARIKAGRHDIHLGYYDNFIEAVQARNVGMACLFGEYGRYNDVPVAPDWIRKKVETQCMRFADLAISGALSVSAGRETA